MKKEYEELRKLIYNAKSIVFLLGAGVSTKSGIPDFRSPNGIYNLKQKYNVSYEDILSYSFFVKHPDIFYDFYKSNMMHLAAKPNLAHTALARLEKQKEIMIITQNIDGLHQEAGSKRIIELHGSIHRNYCTNCGEFYNASDIKMMQGIPKCLKCGAIIKPDVVLYGEPLDQTNLENSIRAIQNADLLIVGGTSLNVYPAAGLIQYFAKQNLILINKEETPFDYMAKQVIKYSIDEVLDNVIKK